jgi:hypothetical protein
MLPPWRRPRGAARRLAAACEGSCLRAGCVLATFRRWYGTGRGDRQTGCVVAGVGEGRHRRVRVRGPTALQGRAMIEGQVGACWGRRSDCGGRSGLQVVRGAGIVGVERGGLCGACRLFSTGRAVGVAVSFDVLMIRRGCGGRLTLF